MLLTKQTLHAYSEWLQSVPTEGGVALIDKPLNWTSFDVVARLRKLTSIKKIGHAGTLDPLATGLLIVCLGKTTKTISNYQDLPKKYRAVIKFGAVTATDDAEAAEDNIAPYHHLTTSEILLALENFVGIIQQVPPMFSALKKNGTPLYKLARKGINIERAPRTITIDDLKLLDVSLPLCTLEITCSKGTYIRSLARDLGGRLGCGAYLYSLQRLQIGEYDVINAITFSELEHACTTLIPTIV